MKISHLYSPSHASKPVKETKTSAVKDQGQETPKDVTSTDSLSDTVSLSQKSRVVQKIAEQLKQVPDIRKEKVETLRSKIENGSYWVDPEEIADKILTEF